MNSSLTPFRRFWRLLHLDRKQIYNIYILAFFSGIMSLSLPLGIQAIINLIQGGEVSTAWKVLVAFVILGVALMGVLQVAQLRIVEDIRQKIFARASFEFAYRIPRIRTEELYDYHAPELANRFFDTMSIQKGLPKILVDFSLATLQILFGLILLSFYHPFFIIFGAVLIILLYIIFYITGPKGLRTSLKESKYKYKVAHWLEEVSRTRTSFQLNGNSDHHLRVTNELVSGYLQHRESHFKVLIRQFNQFIAFKVILAAGLLIIGGVLVFKEQMNIGQFVAAEIIFLLIISSVEKLIVIVETIYDVLTSLEKIGYVTDMSLEHQEGLLLIPSDQGLSVQAEEVSYTYKDKLDPTINNLSLHVKSGDKIHIVGPNGSGKSTLLHLVAGIYKVQGGGLLINDNPLSALDIQCLRENIGFCIANNHLFEGSIYDNVAMGREKVSAQDVRWALGKVGVADFCNRLPNAYLTIIDPEGKKLPRSIIQKLLLARAIVHRPRLLVLEDPLEHVAQEVKKEIIDFLMDDSNPWTVLVVGEDPYWARKSDRIVALENGYVTNEFTFQEFKNTSLYKSLYAHA